MGKPSYSIKELNESLWALAAESLLPELFFLLLHSIFINDIILPHLSALLEISKALWLIQRKEHTLQKLFAVDAVDGDE